MPKKRRSVVVKLAPPTIAAASQGGVRVVESYTKGFLYLEGTNAVVTLQASPDGGTTWYNVYTTANTLWQRTASSPRVDPVEVLPQHIRLDVATAPITSAYLNGIREIA